MTQYVHLLPAHEILLTPQGHRIPAHCSRSEHAAHGHLGKKSNQGSPAGFFVGRPDCAKVRRPRSSRLQGPVALLPKRYQALIPLETSLFAFYTLPSAGSYSFVPRSLASAVSSTALPHRRCFTSSLRASNLKLCNLSK